MSNIPITFFDINDYSECDTKWKMESGKWKMESGKWREESCRPLKYVQSVVTGEGIQYQ
ncbi:MAG: hypothetical protein WBC65_13810 [Ignavibacteria bacterium]